MGDDDRGESSMLSPDAAFSVLGDETRMLILQTLGEADEPLSFTTLRNRVGLQQGSQFNYHLEKLVGHFVEKSDDGYDLTQRGRRVIEAVFSGAVTDEPILEPTRVDQQCFHCGGAILVEYQNERVGLYCTDCQGNYGRSGRWDDQLDDETAGRLGYQRLPPAGAMDRSPGDVLSAAYTWGNLQFMARASGVCPRCSATLEESVQVCEQHDDDGVCKSCDNRYAVQHHARCTNCIYDSTGIFVLSMLANTELLAFLTARGLNPVSSPAELDVYAVTGDYTEEIVSTDPFEARFTFTAEGDSITLAVDDELEVVDVEIRE